MRINLIFLIIIIFFPIIFCAQNGVLNNSTYSGHYTVVDCFGKNQLSGRFSSDSVLKNEILTGQKIWRKINLSDKENNTVFNANGKCSEVTLFEILKFGFLNLNLNVFSSDDFNSVEKYRIDKVTFFKHLSLIDTSKVTSFDAEGNESEEVIITNRYLDGEDVKSYILKENWILNTHSGKIEKRIIGLAPLVFDSKKQKVVPLFWIYYKEWKELLSLFQTNNYRVSGLVSYDEVLDKKYFNSLITKQSNIFDRDIGATFRGQDIIDESGNTNMKFSKLSDDLYNH